MNTRLADSATDYSAPAMIESIARVVASDGNMALLEPELSGGCSSCASSSSCGDQGIGTANSKLAARRFRISNTDHLAIGERVVVGIPESTLLKASFLAYVIPLAAMLAGGVMAQSVYGRDAITLLASLVGLAIGFVLMRLSAKRMSQRGSLAPHYLRRARPGETCNS